MRLDREDLRVGRRQDFRDANGTAGSGLNLEFAKRIMKVWIWDSGSSVEHRSDESEMSASGNGCNAMRRLLPGNHRVGFTLKALRTWTLQHFRYLFKQILLYSTDQDYIYYIILINTVDISKSFSHLQSAQTFIWMNGFDVEAPTVFDEGDNRPDIQRRKEVDWFFKNFAFYHFSASSSFDNNRGGPSASQQWKSPRKRSSLHHSSLLSNGQVQFFF